MQRPLGVQIAHALKARGITDVFGIPGVHNIELYRGLHQAGLRHVLARHEQGAGFMADGYARASGKPGVAFVISGPGLTNIMTPMGQAYSDSVPMIVISIVLPSAEKGRGLGRLHELRDQEGAARAVCAWSQTADTPERMWQLLDRAFAMFAAGRPRPVHIQVPLDVIGAPADPAPTPRALPRRPMAQPGQISDVAEMLSAAKRPVLVIGGGCRDAVAPLTELVEKARVPFFPTYAARGLLGEDHPLSLGATLARPGSKEVFATADLVLAIGTELAETDLWRDTLGHDCPLIRVDIDPTRFDDLHSVALPIVSDAAAFANALIGKLKSPFSRWSHSEVTQTREWLVSTALAERPGPARIIPALVEALPSNVMVLSDMTQLAYLAKEVVGLRKGGRWFHPVGYGTLGYGLPAAIGAKVAMPDRPVLAIVGDSGLQYTIQELGTLAERKLPLAVLLWDNGKLAEIEECMIEAQIAPNNVIAKNPKFGLLARAYGIDFKQPDTLAELPGTISEALRANGPTLIRVTPEIGD
ncbi:5-guanidino-2-oxopentanoate decarboxylase [Pontivivens insulae]|uniref:Putative 2-ketoarginine decarboxylase AruI n=1 Tax=Pontivivens insulae TaxID=1639689 RepID=A0A2R8ACD7_9RHOB|nr:5-guanidino-2-oxopentanoate decarboxylase [Pontivivens insulae]RED13869.1 acetolactate synthase-1/2/3 large subunit/5-guanidino-2-oxopentanoate decarboxylase [Pontivivens insulae]SPF29943.1 putative 2-ketoarginine decarboxylase AruI [Pontivivens insulae]